MHLIKGLKSLHNENDKTSVNEIEEDTQIKVPSISMDRKSQNHLNMHITQSNLEIQGNSYQIPRTYMVWRYTAVISALQKINQEVHEFLWTTWCAQD